MDSEAITLLGYADGLLSGRIEVSGDAARLAAFVARRGVEALIDQYCEEQCGHLLDPHRPSPWNDARWASKLAILLSRDDDYGRALIYAWVELSNLCHEHAYQLTPTIDEVRNLCLTVMTQAAGRPVA